MAKVLKRSKKTRRNISEGVVSINASLNNTHVVVSDKDGQVLSWATGGSAGFKGAREATPYAAQITSESAVSKAKTLHGLEKAIVYVKGIGAGREQAIRGIINSWVDLTAIYDITPVPHNGCRKKKVRKL
ncbi:MAG: 30S ribosomal protein S11 [uncultured bacterium (gcode 4)]|uniref:Small ribosomal subunit protein uS11 n=1 Tax=uncultured bacterium (gcode 4) TaxID=1234023 RepID=K1XIH8_9BACT|nr:MAG: 30S ribosomal protein S11 [uncultured bacterium (gcode 4)]